MAHESDTVSCDTALVAISEAELSQLNSEYGMEVEGGCESECEQE